MIFGSGSVYVYKIIQVTARFRFNERNGLIRVFGLLSGLVRRPGYNDPFRYSIGLLLSLFLSFDLTAIGNPDESD